jgi:hypothetical protein
MTAILQYSLPNRLCIQMVKGVVNLYEDRDGHWTKIARDITPDIAAERGFTTASIRRVFGLS